MIKQTARPRPRAGELEQQELERQELEQQELEQLERRQQVQTAAGRRGGLASYVSGRLHR